MKENQGISSIAVEDILVQAIDTSQLDFTGFGYLKRELVKRRPIISDSVWKVSQEVWSTIDNDIVKKVFDGWKRRLRMVAQNNGEHIEHLNSIHSRHININNFK